MKHNYFKKFVLAVTLTGALVTGKAQSAFYTEDFDSGSPVGWTSTAEWVLDNSVLPTSNGYTGASGNFYYGASNGSTSTETLEVSGISTMAFSNITIQWGAYMDPSFPVPVTFQWSPDGVTWNTVSYTNVNNDATWAQISSFSLPSGAAGQSNLRLRWMYTGNNNSNYFAIDDVVLSGDIIAYYSKSTGNLDVLSTWGTNYDGSGIQPANFTSNTKTYYIINNPTPTIASNWVVSGTSAKVSVGDGTLTTNFSIPTGATFTGSMDVTSNCTVTIVNTNSSTFTFATLSASSTVNYAATSTQTMQPIIYQNLTISGNAVKTQANNITVNGVLSMSSGTFQLPTSAFRTLTMNGTLTGSATFSSTAGGSKITIGGTGTFGTLNFATSSNTLHSLTVNRTSSGLVTLGTNLVISNNFQHTAGTINLNGMGLTVNSTAGCAFPSSAATGNLRGSTTSSLTINGSGSITNSLFMDQTSSTTRAMATVIMNRSGQTLTLGNAMDVYESLTPTVGTIATGGNLTLKSSSAAKARIGIIGASGTLSGNATVEVFKPAGTTGWVNLCSGGVNGNTFSNWNSSFAITCSTCPNGSVVGGSPFTSVYSYDETQGAGNAANAAHYIELGSIGTAVNSYTGYWVYLGNGYPNTTSITMPLSGSLNTKNSGGNFNLSLTGGVSTENGWNLLANPYPSPILVSQVIASAGASNVDNALLVYDPDTDANVTYSANTTNSILPMGQAFMIRALNNGVTITPAETWKTTSASNVSIQKSAGPAYIWNDFLLDLSSTAISKNFFSQAYFDFTGGSTSAFDNGRDAISIVSSVDPGTPRIISISNNVEYTRNSLASLSGVITIPVKVSTGYSGMYSINPVNINKLPAGACVALYDIANNITHDLKTGPYVVNIAANATTNQFELKITVNPTTLVSNVTNPTCTKSSNGFIKATGTSSGPWNYTWKDASNTIIKTTNNVAAADTLKNVAQGTYYVDVNTVGSCDNANGTFNVIAATPMPNALFTPNTNTVDAFGNVPVTFVNSSTNASNYTWDFGDGSATVNTPNANHVFSGVGSYVVKLIATNGACADSSIAYTQIDALSLTGISQNTISDNSIIISKDNVGVFVEMNFDKPTTADINVTNILGQIIVSKKQLTGDKAKLYLSVPENERIIFVTVIANDKKITKKVIN